MIDEDLLKSEWFLEDNTTRKTNFKPLKRMFTQDSFFIKGSQLKLVLSDTEEEQKLDSSIIPKSLPQKHQETLNILNSGRIFLKKNLTEVLQTLENLLKLITQIRKKFKDYQNINEKLLETLNYLQVLEIQIKIFQELILNCSESPSQVLSQIKSLLTPLKKVFFINAQTMQNINTVFLNDILNLLRILIFPRIFALKQYLKTNVEKFHDKLYFEASVVTRELSIWPRQVGSACDAPQDDLIALQYDHERWQGLQSIIQVKKLADAGQIQQSYYTFTKTVRVGHALIFKRNKYQSPIIRNLIFLGGAFYYFIHDKKAAMRAMAHISELEVDSAQDVMNILELPAVTFMTSLTLPPIKTNIKVYLDPYVEPFTPQEILREMKAGTLNKITKKEIKFVNNFIHQDDSSRDEIFKKSKQKITIRILCHEKLEQPNNDLQWQEDSLFKRLFKKKIQPPTIYDTVIIHIHGGGFIASSSGQHQSYTRQWANKLKVPIFSIDYSLAPQYPYPYALDDCWQAYHWILNNVSQYFNIQPARVILAGDSAGANLCLALTGLAIKYGAQVPDGIYIAYPAIEMQYKYSPSHMLAFQEQLLTHSILDICISSYCKGDYADPINDPFLSPGLFSDEILQYFPPCRIVYGSKEPLKDHSIRFGEKLKNNKRDVKLIEYEELSHGFLGFWMKEVQTCIQDSIDLIKEMIDNCSKKI